MSGDVAAMRDRLVALLAAMVMRRRQLRIQLVVEALASILGAAACLVSRDRSGWAIATVWLAFLAAYLAVRDYQRIRRVRGQITALARVVAPLV